MSSVTIATLSNPIDANIAKDVLQREGIECFLADENISRIYPTSAFGVRLMIDEADVARAKEILRGNELAN